MIYIYVCVCDGVVIYLENQLYISINCVFSIATFDYQRGNITHTYQSVSQRFIRARLSAGQTSLQHYL